MKTEFPSDAKFLLVGLTTNPPFFAPSGSLYATPFNTQPLLTLAGDGTPEERLERLREAGVQYIWVDWKDLDRLAYSYGLPEELFAEMVRRRTAGLPPGLRQIEELKPAGVIELQAFYPPPNRPFSVLTPTGETVHWPIFTLYAMPWATITQWPEPPEKDTETRGRGDAEK